MKAMPIHCAVCTLLALMTAALSAHEITTHALITERAYQQSTLNSQNDNSIIPLLGFDRLAKDHPFAWRGITTPAQPANFEEMEGYYDDATVTDTNNNLPPYPPSSAGTYLRMPQQQERKVLQNLVSGGYLPGTSGHAIEQQVRSWLMRGAVREDDNDVKPLPDLFPSWWVTVGERDTDPYGHILRALKHFYDPYYARAAQTPECGDYGCIPSPVWALGYDDPFDETSLVETLSRRNHFTWRDARNNYWWALTLQRNGINDPLTSAKISSAERLHRWATTINDLGHVIHLLQDTSQPQHVRNDMHGPPVHASAGAKADSAFEAYTDYRVIRNYDYASRYNPLTNPLRHMVGEDVPTVNYLPRIQLGMANPYPGNGGHVMFSRPAKFFSTHRQEPGCDAASLRSRRGMADFSNRNFFTAGTLPGFREASDPVPGTAGCPVTAGPTYALPPNDLSDPDYTQMDVPSGLSVGHRVVFLTEYAYPISDSVAPGYDQTIHSLAPYGGKAPLLTKSIFNTIITDHPSLPPFPPASMKQIGYTLTYNNLRTMADVELPRAVGYSAGMIDYFFRGRLDLSSPPGGLFGVVDQGTPHTVDSNGTPHRVDDGRVFGFETLRVRIKNATDDIVESGTGTVYPQDAQNGELVAIARYHRNPCYQPDLSGEYVKKPDGTLTVPAGCSVAQTRTDYQEISVSAPLVIDANGNLAGVNNGTNPCANVGNLDTVPTGTCANSDGVLAEFDFSSDPIPINATDLYLQVAYRGHLGEEVDGIALGRMDLLEPNYYTIWNNTDWFLYNGVWRDPAEVTGSVPGGADPIPISIIYMCWEDQFVFGFGQPDPVGPGQFLRFATLADQLPHTITELAEFGGRVSAWSYYPFVGSAHQAEQEVGGPWNPAPLLYGRGTTLGTLWDDYYLDYPAGAYAPPHNANDVSLTLFLAPTLGTENGPGPGLPVHGIAGYSNLPDSTCALYTNSTSAFVNAAPNGMQVERSHR